MDPQMAWAMQALGNVANGGNDPMDIQQLGMFNPEMVTGMFENRARDVNARQKLIDAMAMAQDRLAYQGRQANMNRSMDWAKMLNANQQAGLSRENKLEEARIKADSESKLRTALANQQSKLQEAYVRANAMQNAGKVDQFTSMMLQGIAQKKFPNDPDAQLRYYMKAVSDFKKGNVSQDAPVTPTQQPPGLLQKAWELLRPGTKGQRTAPSQGQVPPQQGSPGTPFFYQDIWKPSEIMSDDEWNKLGRQTSPSPQMRQPAPTPSMPPQVQTPEPIQQAQAGPTDQQWAMMSPFQRFEYNMYQNMLGPILRKLSPLAPRGSFDTTPMNMIGQ